jgi:hypothetical protein
MARKMPLAAWRIVVIRKKAEYVGTVEANDARSAIAAAIKEFEITDRNRQQRLSRLMW